MLNFLAQSALEFALLLSLLQIFAYRLPQNWQKAAVVTNFLLVAFAFVVLVYAFAVSDFSLKLVFENSHTQKPLFYKIAGTWGNHEGSILLFISGLAVFSLALLHDAKASSVMGGVSALFLGFLLFSSNPFAPLPLPASEGLGLNPLLQDVGLAFHPPSLYAGYTGFVAVFALAVSCLLRGEISAASMLAMRKLCTISWALLTAGICLGSWWAYRELGWGGFWFWDPVENSSLVPWFLATALLHSLIAADKRKILQKWVILLAILVFLGCLAGFFLVRSGILSSVHAFAVDPARGYFILAILCICALPSLVLYGIKSEKFASSGQYEIVSRETAILFNNLLTIAISATVFVGTIFPFVLDLLTAEKIAVGYIFYNKIVVPIMLVLLVACAVGALLAWRQDELRRVLKNHAWHVLFATWLTIILAVLLELAVYEVVALLSILLLLAIYLPCIGKVESKQYPMMVAHTGLALLALGIFSEGVFAQEKMVELQVGEYTKFVGRKLQLGAINEGAAKNYVYRRGDFLLDDKLVQAESRIYPFERSQTFEAGIAMRYLSDYYVVLGEKSAAGAFAVRLYFKPLINLIWIGGFLMFLAGILRFERLRAKG